MFELHDPDQLEAEAAKHNTSVVSYGQAGKLSMSHRVTDRRSKMDIRIENLQKKHPNWTADRCMKKLEAEKEKKDRLTEERYSRASFNQHCVHCNQPLSKHDDTLYGHRCYGMATYYEEISEELRKREEKADREYLRKIRAHDDGDWNPSGESEESDDESEVYEMAFCLGTGGRCKRKKCEAAASFCKVAGLCKRLRRAEKDAKLLGIVKEFVNTYDK
ncbi:hypothetical protein EBR25_13915 [bacterium]|nr:hypothetical protein [bacterium]